MERERYSKNLAKRGKERGAERAADSLLVEAAISIYTMVYQ
jgi:hypothetical protein